LILIILGVCGYSIWKTGLIPEGKNYPNITVLSMVLLFVGQIIRIVQSRKNGDKQEI
jgi:hypothetical protein